ncbi:recombinase family protein [Sphingobacterium sp. KU25419]|nr:recombinase family protein [Sphingobacterium sp. KU25419]
MKKAYLYIRVSTDEQAETGYSQRNQEESLRRYCTINSIEVLEVIYEDHSAKSFQRPQWKKLLVLIKKNKGKNALVLFTKWDRFSRNAGDSYQMINLLSRMGAEPQAIEQPLDLSVPENKMMLAFYLASPEVENDRRALNVFHGMRRAKKEGRWMGTAPIGYKNCIDESNRRKYIAADEKIGPVMIWVFEQLAANIFNTQQIFKVAKERGIKCGKSNFWVAIRNPIYCGKIFVPPLKEESGHFVTGQHVPLISETLFYQCQEVLDGRKRNTSNNPKITSDEMLPLRGFLGCPECNRLLTGSASKGRNQHYYYYHCTGSCGVRFKAELVNSEFISYLKNFVPRPGVLELCTKEIVAEFKSENSMVLRERKRLIEEIDMCNKRLSNARILRVEGELDEEDFRALKEDINDRMTSMEANLGRLSGKNKEIDEIIEDSLKQIEEINKFYETSTLERKRNIIGSMFPEKLVFDGTRHRTARINRGVELIYLKTNKLKGKKNGTNQCFSDLSHEVLPTGLEPVTKRL